MMLMPSPEPPDALDRERSKRWNRSGSRVGGVGQPGATVLEDELQVLADTVQRYSNRRVAPVMAHDVAQGVAHQALEEIGPAGRVDLGLDVDLDRPRRVVGDEVLALAARTSLRFTRVPRLLAARSPRPGTGGRPPTNHAPDFSPNPLQGPSVLLSPISGFSRSSL